MRIQYFFTFIGIFAVSLIPFMGLAQSTELASSDSKQRLISGAEHYVQQQVEVKEFGQLKIQAQKLDSRISIPKCADEFVYKASPESLRQANVTVKASCPSNNWYLFLMVKTQQIQPVVVLTQTLSPGSLITQANTRVEQLDRKQLRSSTFSAQLQVIGAKVKRRTRPGQPLTPQMLCFVCKGDAVTIRANMAGLQIKTAGIAQQDGNVGDTIQVQNSHSKKMINALVASTKQVEVSI